MSKGPPEAGGGAPKSCPQHLHWGESFCFFILNVLLYSHLESEKSHFSVGLRSESEFRVNPLPSCYLSIRLHVPCLGQEPRVPRIETSGLASGPGCATKGLQMNTLPLWASFSHL